MTIGEDLSTGTGVCHSMSGATPSPCHKSLFVQIRGSGLSHVEEEYFVPGARSEACLWLIHTAGPAASNATLSCLLKQDIHQRGSVAQGDGALLSITQSSQYYLDHYCEHE